MTRCAKHRKENDVDLKYNIWWFAKEIIQKLFKQKCLNTLCFSFKNKSVSIDFY